MTRLQNTLLPQGTAYARGETNAMVNLANGGMFGYSPDMAQIVSAQGYVTHPTINLLMEAPLGFRRMPDSAAWVEALKAIVELHPISVTGLQSALEVKTDTTAVGGAGEMLDDITNVTRQRTEVQMTIPEKYGKPISRFFQAWIRLLMMHEETKYALINTIPGVELTDMLMDQYSMTMLFIEPDPLHRKVVEAYLVTNMFPLSSGVNESKRDVTQDQTLVKHDIKFAGVTQIGLGVKALAQRILDNNNITGANPYAAKSFIDQIAPDVTNAANTGYGALIQKLANTAIKV